LSLVEICRGSYNQGNPDRERLLGSVSVDIDFNPVPMNKKEAAEYLGAEKKLIANSY
jgi:hypothetical protein